MNCTQAKAIPLAEILTRLGTLATRCNGHQHWYLSPFRQEKTPSLHVHHDLNVWYDFGAGKGGNVVDLAVAYLDAAGEPAGTRDALRFLTDLTGGQPFTAPPITQTKCHDEFASGHWLLKGQKPVSHLALRHYLNSRGIPLRVAQRHLKELSVSHSETNTKLFALGMRNEEEGWEMRNPFMKACVGSKAITFARGIVPKSSGIHLFEGMMDFLSVTTRDQNQSLRFDSIILNSLSCLPEALPYLRNYGYETMFCWMDNDEAGKKATQILAEFSKSQQIACLAMNKIYAGYKDVSDWHVATLPSHNREPRLAL